MKAELRAGLERIILYFAGLADSVLDPSGAEAKTPTFDGFYAAQQGSQAFAFHASNDDPELCVFTWVLHRGLTFANPEAAIVTSEGGRVTSGSLADYLDRAVPAEAAARDVWQQPITNTGFRPPNDGYAERALRASRGPSPPGYKSVVRDSPAPTRPQRSIDDLRQRIVSEWRAPFQDWAFSHAQSETIGDLLLIDFAGEELRINGRSDTPLRPVEPFHSPGDPQEDDRRAVAILRSSLWKPVHMPSHTVLVSVDNYSVLVPLHYGLWCALRINTRRDDGNVTDVLTWGSPYYNPGRDGSLSPLEVLKGLLLGRIRIDDVSHIAAAVRVGKHQDPQMGIVAAYLYDSIGDVENNRRMCWYYHAHHQDVPFDIALLARAPIERIGDGFVIHVPPRSEELAKVPNSRWKRPLRKQFASRASHRCYARAGRSCIQ